MYTKYVVTSEDVYYLKRLTNLAEAALWDLAWIEGIDGIDGMMLTETVLEVYQEYKNQKVSAENLTSIIKLKLKQSA